jgi:hypothetical protein
MKTIINIGSGGTPSVTSYEDAFGDYGQEYSEARGRGRRRRQAKKLERIANKKEVQTARRDLKSSKQQGRIEQRRGAMESRQNIRTERRRTGQERKNEQQQYRQGRRDTALQSRQGRRDSALQSRQARRDFAKTSRVNRKDIGAEEDYEEPIMDDTQTGGGAPQYDEPQYDDSQPQYDDSQPQYDDSQNGGGQQYDEPQYDDSQNYAPEEDNVGDEGYQDTGYADENNYEDSEDGFGFDGGDEFSHEESADIDYINIESLPIYKNAMKIEQNKERIQQLDDKKKYLTSINRANPTVRNEIDQEISKRKEIISNLEGQLDEFSSADGRSSDMTKLAKMKAKVKRLEYKNTNNSLDGLIDKQKEECAVLESRINRPTRGGTAKRFGGTRLDAELRTEQIVINPQMSKLSGGDDEIDIENGFNACGCSTGFDGGEFDMEQGSLATGNTKPSVLSKINWTGVAIGVGVSALLIFGAERMKLFGNK